MNATKPIPIAPQSVVRLVHSDRATPSWHMDRGRIFRIGYYSRKDGLDCVWLVNDEGKYEQATDHEFLYRYFDVIHFASDANWYGRRRPRIPPIRPADSRKPRARGLPKKGTPGVADAASKRRGKTGTT
jgi:hypothetical protein